MQILELIYPMAALFTLTFFIMYLMLFVRVKAVRSRQVSPRYFKLNKGGELPEQVEAIAQNYGNLLEFPVLFYSVCIIAIILNKSADYFIYCAWAFVISRVIHSYIHITYNHILHRLAAFAISGFILILMWLKVVLIVANKV
ncbi:MAG: MAPEG family protein [Gammaproteobacteria bacterium]|nr:MAPEG family protein [Gammaproteobacteria bacterium]MCW8986084.1 MAPEG family protein [Gammaproteobacteria bacterium]MCW9030730.1 MAPEG family protein [Gammaproteobacteria bacterium]